MSEEDNGQISPINPLTIGELITLPEAAQLTGFNPKFLAELAAKGRLKAKRSGSAWLTTMAAVEVYLSSRHRGKKIPVDKTD
jgi:hypothetical protein